MEPYRGNNDGSLQQPPPPNPAPIPPPNDGMNNGMPRPPPPPPPPAYDDVPKYEEVMFGQSPPPARVAVGDTVTLLHPPSVGVSIAMERGSVSKMTELSPLAIGRADAVPGSAGRAELLA